MYQVIIFTGTGSRDLNLRIGAIRAIGAYRIATELRNHGYTVKVLDYTAQLSSDPEYFQKVFDKYVSKETLWVGISSTFLEDPKTNYFLDRLLGSAEVWAKLKSDYPKLKIVYGGSRAYKTVPGVDIYVEGYADTTVVELTKSLNNKLSSIQYNRSAGEVRVTSDKTAASFDFYNSRSEFTPEDYVHWGAGLPIEIARGCIFKCSFCAYPLNGKNKKDYLRNLDILREELEYNYAQYGVTTYHFSDDTFNDYTEKLELLYENVVRKLSFKLRFAGYIRLDLVQSHPEQIELLKALGIRGAFFGIESLNHKAASFIKKGGDPESKLEFAHKLRELWPDTLLSAGLIVGLPYDTRDKLEEWLPLTYNNTSPFHTVNINYLGLDFSKSKVWRSDIEDNPTKFGYIELDNDRGWYNAFSDLTREEVIKIAKHHKDAAAAAKKHLHAQEYVKWVNLGYSHKEILSWSPALGKDFAAFPDCKDRWRNIINQYKTNILK